MKAGIGQIRSPSTMTRVAGIISVLFASAVTLLCLAPFSFDLAESPKRGGEADPVASQSQREVKRLKSPASPLATVPTIEETPQVYLEVLRRAKRENRSLSDYAEVLNLITDGVYRQFETDDLWELYQFFYEEFEKQPLRIFQLRKIRVELGRRGEVEIIRILRDEVEGPIQGLVTIALEDLGEINTPEAIFALVDIWEDWALREDDGQAVVGGDVAYPPVALRAAMVLRGSFPNAPVWVEEKSSADLRNYRTSNAERFRRWYQQEHNQ